MPDGGGGGGGDTRAAQEDEAKKARARNKLNVLFGIAPNADALAAEKLAPDQTTQVLTQSNPAARAAAAKPVAPGTDPRVAEAATAKTARDADYQKIFDDTLALNKDAVGRQHDVAARMNKFQILRQGQAGGSLDVDQAALLKEKNDQLLLDAANKGNIARTGARTTDEGARLDLLRQISGGLDAGSAADSAVRGMDLARQNAYDVARGNIIEGGFDTAGLLYQGNQQAGAIKRGRDLYQKLAGAQTPGGSSYAGKLG